MAAALDVSYISSIISLSCLVFYLLSLVRAESGGGLGSCLHETNRIFAIFTPSVYTLSQFERVTLISDVYNRILAQFGHTGGDVPEIQDDLWLAGCFKTCFLAHLEAKNALK